MTLNDLDPNLSGKMGDKTKPRKAGVWLAYSPDQPRDDHGRWTSDGGGGGEGEGWTDVAASPAEMAAGLREQAERIEPRTTHDISEVAQRVGGEINTVINDHETLDFRLKTEESLERKLNDKIEEGMTPFEASDSVKDSVRYTMDFESDEYADGTRAAIDGLKEHGWEELRTPKDAWAYRDDSYDGINTQWEVDGTKVEVQFHTFQSHETKEYTHVNFYQPARSDETPPEVKEELLSGAAHAWQEIPTPPGVEGIGEPARF